ncbi:hypothetical protein DFJ73DRAFT_966768 [Zopfochytrium polystomum]|nr:hypothetical protein DFJ73DRAFT_966768 [Zopfochytrium polystomum]
MPKKVKRQVFSHNSTSFCKFAFNENMDCLKNIDSPPAPFIAACDDVLTKLYDDLLNPVGKLARHLPTRRNREIQRVLNVVHGYALDRVRARRTQRAASEVDQGGDNEKKNQDLLDLFVDP